MEFFFFIKKYKVYLLSHASEPLFQRFPRAQTAAQFLDIAVFQFLLSSHYSFQICHLSTQFLSLYYMTTESLFPPSCLSPSQLKAQQLSFVSLSVLHVFVLLAISEAHQIVQCSNISRVARHAHTCKTGCVHIFFGLVQFLVSASGIATPMHSLIGIEKTCP